jgi:RNA polymerase sigma-70 factor (ECF subfamily)
MFSIGASQNVLTIMEPGPSSEAALIVRARGGDASAFEQLMEIHEHQVLRTAGRVLGRREEARDAAQEVFLRLYRHLPSIREEHDLKPWLYRVTVNVCRDIARKNYRVPTLPLEEREFESPSAEGTSVIDELDLARRRELIQTALGRLSEGERAAVMLRDIEGLSSTEAARALGSSAATIRSQVASARLKIRRFCLGALRRGI